MADEFKKAYKLKWKAKDEDGNMRDNMWEVGDMALVKTFNQAKVGTSHNVSNDYWWAKVVGVSDNEEGREYNWIMIDNSDYDGVLNPQPGQNVVMLGNRAGKVDRQSAIYISAYSSLDSGLVAPFVAQYRGINDYSNIGVHRQSYFDAKGATFKGNITLGGNTNIEDYIQDKIDDLEIEQNIKFSDDEWSVYPCSNYTRVDLDGNIIIDGLLYIDHWGRHLKNGNRDDFPYNRYKISCVILGGDTYHSTDIGIDIEIGNSLSNTGKVTFANTYQHPTSGDRTEYYAHIRFLGNVSKDDISGWETEYGTGHIRKAYHLKFLIRDENDNIIFKGEEYPIQYEPGALWEVNNELGIIRGLVGDTSGNLSEYLQTAEQISLKVENLELDLAQLKVTKDEISLEVLEDGLKTAGLEINSDGTNTFTGSVIASDFRVTTENNNLSGAQLLPDQVMVITTWAKAKVIAGDEIPTELAGLTDDVPVFLLKDPKTGEYYVLNAIKLVNNRYGRIDNVYPYVDMTSKTMYYTFGDDGKIYSEPDTSKELSENKIFYIASPDIFYIQHPQTVDTAEGARLLEIGGLEMIEYKYNSATGKVTTGNHWYYINDKKAVPSLSGSGSGTINITGGIVSTGNIKTVRANSNYYIGNNYYTANTELNYVSGTFIGTSSNAITTIQLSSAELRAVDPESPDR